jgi:ADP-heptose:LPS heptosyltransferase
MIINTDCKYYLGNKPCIYHKIDKRPCENCTKYKQFKKRVLIIKLDALGDVLRTTSILPSLVKKFPDSHITWVTKSNASVLLKNNEYINRVLTIETNYLDYIINEEFDLGICLDADNMGATILSISKCKEKLGFYVNSSGQLIPANKEAEKWYRLGLNDTLKKTNRETYQRIIYKICLLDGEIYKPQYIIEKGSDEYGIEFSRKNKLEKYKVIIGINTGGGSRWECKSWIKEYYIELINKLHYLSNEIGIILFGGEKEKELIKFISDNIKFPVIDAECYSSVNKFAEVINLTDIFLTPDTLGFHLSIALDKYTIVLVGPTSPWELDVYGKGKILYNENLDCIACYDTVCKKNKECMISLTPDYILKKITKRINEIRNR